MAVQSCQALPSLVFTGGVLSYMGVFDVFGKRNRVSKELRGLNDACNSLFNEIFNKCRLEYGRELVEVMNLKAAMLGTMEKTRVGGISERIAARLLNLTAAYFNLINECSSIKAGAETADGATDTLKARLDKAHELITSLNRHFYLATIENLSADDFDETLKEAEALCNAISINYEGKRGDGHF